jgi:tetratricopeptide (TPR) repeat protein
LGRVRLARRAFALLLATLLAVACGHQPNLEEVRSLQASELYAETEAPLRALLARNPDDPELNFRLGLALAHTGRKGEAVFPLRKAAASEDFAMEAGQVLADLLLGMRNFEEAIREADGVLARDPGNAAALFVKGRAAGEVGRFEIALESADAILAERPDDLDGLVLRGRALASLSRLDEAEATYRRVREVGARDPARAPQTCLALALFVGERRHQVERATGLTAECLAQFPDDPAAVAPAAHVYDAIDHPAEGTEVVRHGLARWPADATLRDLLVQRLIHQGQLEEAETVLLDGIRSAPSPERWLAVADVRRRRGDPAGALQAVEEALALRPADPEAAQFAAADLLVDLGRTDEAEARLRDLEEPAYRLNLEGRLALERGDPRRALDILTRAIEQWPGNAGARIQAARAANELGQIDRAISELREATRTAPDDTDAALLLGRLYLLQGEPERALAFLSRQREHRGFATAEPYLLSARALVQAGHPGKARALLKEFGRQEGHAALALAELARMDQQTAGPAATARRIEQSGLDLGEPANEPALRAWVQAQLALGRGADAAKRLDALEAARPDTPVLPAIRGQIALASGDLQPAQEAFEHALELDPDSAAALAGEGFVALRRGDSARALERLATATAAAPDEPDYAYGLAQAKLAAGDTGGAETTLRRLLRSHPEHPGAANDLAWLLARRGDALEWAQELAERAVRLAPSAETRDTLGFVLWRRGEREAARKALEQALAARPDYATARYHLGLVQLDAGERDAARSSLEQALAEGGFPEADDARSALRRLD